MVLLTQTFFFQGKQKVYFKPKRYNISDVIRGNIYAGYDRYNSEVFTYYLAMILNYKWVAPSVIRKIRFNKEVLAHATAALKRTMIKNGEYFFKNIRTNKQPVTE